jgi:hypothetical protein
VFKTTRSSEPIAGFVHVRKRIYAVVENADMNKLDDFIEEYRKGAIEMKSIDDRALRVLSRKTERGSFPLWLIASGSFILVELALYILHLHFAPKKD